MKAAMITYLGGAEDGDMARTVWGTSQTGTIEFPVNTPVYVNPSEGGQMSAFLAKVIEKASKNRFFKVSDATDADKARAAQTKIVRASEPKPVKKKAKDED